MKIKPRFSEEERKSFIEQWKQSGKNKLSFCKEKGLNYYSFNTWIKPKVRKKKSGKPSFVALKVDQDTDFPFAEIVLRNGTVIRIFQRIEPGYLSGFIR